MLCLALAGLAGLCMAWMLCGFARMWFWTLIAAALLLPLWMVGKRFRLLTGCLIAACLCCTCLWLSFPSWFLSTDYAGEILHYSGTVTQVRTYTNLCRLTLNDVSAGSDRNSLHNMQGKLLVEVSDPGREFEEGDRLFVKGRARLLTPKSWMGDSDERLMALSEGIRLILPCEKQDLHRVGRSDPVGLRAFTQRIRRSIDQSISENFDEDSAGLIRALTLGDSGGIPYGIRDSFRKLGLSHVLAISGLHVSLLFEGLNELRRRKGWWAHPFHAASYVLVGLYLVIADFRLSLLRVVYMQLIRTLSEHSCRRYDAFSALGAAFLVQTVFTPWAFLDMGFELSYLGTAALLLFSQEIDLAEKSRARLLVPSAVTGAVTLGSWPFTALHFGEIAPASLLGNLIFVPLMPVVLLSCMLWLATLVFSPSGFAPLRLLLQWVSSSYLSGITLLGADLSTWHLTVHRLPLIVGYAWGLTRVSSAFGKRSAAERMIAAALCVACAVGMLVGIQPHRGFYVLGQADQCALVCVTREESCLILREPVEDIREMLREKVGNVDRLILTGDSRSAARILRQFGEDVPERVELPGQSHEGKIDVAVTEHVAGEGQTVRLTCGEWSAVYGEENGETCVRFSQGDGSGIRVASAPWEIHADWNVAMDGCFYVKE